jgi:hypothetical protein
MDTTSNVILVVGYRALLIMAPLMLVSMGRHAVCVAFLIGTLGCVLWYVHIPIPAAGCIALGLSVGGFLLKDRASATAAGAAWNKIAVNVGSLLAGACVVLLPNTQKVFMLGAGSVLLICACACVRPVQSDEHSLGTGKFGGSGFARLVIWAAVGIAFGIKFGALYAVLPQYIMSLGGGMHRLPEWYGWMVSINSIVVLAVQIPIMRALLGRDLGTTVLWPLLAAMIVMATPNLFLASTITGAIVWTLILSLIECAVSYSDVLATCDGALLAKEICVGIGFGLSVFGARLVPAYGGLIVGSVGGTCVLIALAVNRVCATRIVER